jgi:hypothetical protein
MVNGNGKTEANPIEGLNLATQFGILIEAMKMIAEQIDSLQETQEEILERLNNLTNEDIYGEES